MHSYFSLPGILPVVLLVYLNFTCWGSLRLSRQLGGHERVYEAPEISMRSVSPHWLNIQCTVPKSSSEFKVFVTCPALSAPCYENCLPIQSCSEVSSPDAECLPDRTAVNCTELANSDGSKLTSLWIDKRSPRLHGSWVCTSLGVKSSVVNVVPEMEETQDLEVLEESSSSNNAELVDPDKLKDAVGRREENGKPPFYAITAFLSRTPWIFCLIAVFIVSITVNIILWCRWCLVCFFTARRRKYNEDQKTLGDMICLPTQMSRTQSGLWENDVYPSPFIDDLGEPYCLKENSTKFHRFGTFGPGNFTYEQGQLQNHTEFTDMAFPQYFNTMQPNQLWRARSAVATFSPGNLSLTSGCLNHLQTNTGSLNQVTSQIDNAPPPPPPPLLLNQPLHETEDPKRSLRVNMNLAPGITTVYDDVASSSTGIYVFNIDPLYYPLISLGLLRGHISFGELRGKSAQCENCLVEPYCLIFACIRMQHAQGFSLGSDPQMELPAESGLKIAARILARGKPSIFEALFADPVGSKFGPDIADFAFPKNAFSLKQNVLFDTILVHIFPSHFDGKKTGGLDAFALFIENFLSKHYPVTSHSKMVDEVHECPTYIPQILRSTY
ncbi:hypothetical protein TcWFU_010361 [Taenia crassiceps]|uniref:Uncharacterized protein n=1 Tax=Taenia crassiceps TaxID=6207 RepID=A0ABR4QUA2_9CEST